MTTEAQLSTETASSRSLWQVGLIIGLATGVFSGLLGIGGAAILIPGMVELMGIRQHQAHGTSLMVMIPAAALSAVVYALSQPLDWSLIAIFSAASMVGAVIGARLMTHVPAPTLKRVFGIFLLVVAIRMLLSAGGDDSQGAELGSAAKIDFPLIGEILLGLVAGVGSGLLGIGGGQILIPGMTMLLGIPQKVAQGVSLAFIVPTALAGALTHHRKGNVAPRIGLLLIPGAIVGGLIGAALAQLLPSTTLQQLFGIFLLYMSIRMIAPTFYGRLWQTVSGLWRRG